MSLRTKLWSDLKTDEERSAWLLLGRGYETGVVAQALQNDLAMAYHRLAALSAATTPAGKSLKQLAAEHGIDMPDRYVAPELRGHECDPYDFWKPIRDIT